MLKTHQKRATNALQMHVNVHFELHTEHDDCGVS